MKKLSIITLGCKVNQSESADLIEQLDQKGYRIAKKAEPADLCLINTCAVTQKAAMQSRRAVRKIIRRHPGAEVVVTGCYAQLASHELSGIQGVTRVVSQDKKTSIPDMVSSGNSPKNDPDISNQKILKSRTRPFLKIQDGCNAVCTYCIVPAARGKSRSLPPDRVIGKLNGYRSQGFREVVLTGIHMGQYGRDLTPGTDLYELLRRIEKTKPDIRIRLSSIEPNELTDGIISLVAASSIYCPHFHVPLQSGDDDILRQMRRPYKTILYQEIIRKIRHRLPDAAIGADVMSGFPGESDAAHERTVQLIESLPLTYLHVFPFSPRKGTPATRFPDPVPTETVKRRCAELRRLGEREKIAFSESFIGRELDVLIESKKDAASGRLKGISENYISVYPKGGDALMNQRLRIRIDGIFNKSGVTGTIIRQS